MVVYTPNALATMPGGVTPAAMEGLIADEMLIASEAFTKSKTNVGLRLVHTEQVASRPKISMHVQQLQVPAFGIKMPPHTMPPDTTFDARYLFSLRSTKARNVA